MRRQVMRRVALLAAFGLGACVSGTPAPPPDTTVLEVLPTLPEGYPPKIGTVSATLDGSAQSWETFDYSIGAFDASVQVLNFNGQVQFNLMGETPGKPDLQQNRLLMKADMTKITQTGALANPIIELVAGKEWEGPRLTSVGSATSLVLDSLKPMGPQGEYGHVKGSFTTTLCAADGEPAKVDRTKCQPFSGSFDSDLQIGGP